MVDIKNPQEHKYAEDILISIARLMQFHDDFMDCWGDTSISGKIGTDIQEGKCTWLIVNALQISNSSQIEVLKSNYGKDDTLCVNKIKRIFEELGFKRIYKIEKNKKYKEICEMIDGIKNKSILNPKIFYTLLNQLSKKYELLKF